MLGRAMGLVYDARAPADGPVEKVAFRKGQVSALKRAGRWISEAEPARAAAGTVPAQSPVFVGPCRSWESHEVRVELDPQDPPPPPPPSHPRDPSSLSGGEDGRSDPTPPPLEASGAPRLRADVTATSLPSP